MEDRLALMPVAARSKALVCARSLAGVASSNPSRGAWISVSCEHYVLSGRSFCDGPIPHPEQPYRVCVYMLLSVIRRTITLYPYNE
jgi:hypothetical protein